MATNIFLFVPNLIGYARIVFAFVAFYYFPRDHNIAFWSYMTSCLLDAFDGHAARYLNQSTRFGAVLDMVTDRCTTACLMVTLANLYPDYAVAFQFLISLDIGSHWIHMYSSLIRGQSSHKAVSKNNWFLHLYYTSRPVLFWMCAGNETFFAALYLLHFQAGPLVTIAGMSVGLWQLLAAICFPVCFAKQFISVIHIVSASKDIAELDLADRKQKGL
eukprot:Opistho-2@79323